MPRYGRRNYRKKNYKKRNTYVRKRPATVAQAVSRYMTKNAEIKRVTDNYLTEAISLTPFLRDLTAEISQGDGRNQRSGDALKHRGLYIKGQFKMEDEYNVCRLIFFV